MGFNRDYSMLLVVGFILLIFSSSAYSSSISISTGKASYLVDEVVMITLSQSTPKTQVIISSGTDNYKFLGIPDKKLIFIPKNPGRYSVNVNDPYSSTDQTIYFDVTSPVLTSGESRQSIGGSSSLSSNIRLDRKEYQTEDIVNIRIINLKPEKMIISNGIETYKFLGVISGDMEFIPKKEGVYTIELLDEAGDIIDEIQFNVANKDSVKSFFQPDNAKYLSNPYQIRKPQRSVKRIYLVPEIKDSKGIRQEYTIKTKESNMFSSRNAEILLDDWEPELTIEPDAMKIKKVVFKDLDLQKGFDLGIEKVPSDAIDDFNGKILDVFAIDPERLNFSYAVMTVEAVGNEIYKCAAWNFTKRQCQGEWLKVLDTTPGFNYTIFLTPKDPAYLQTTKNADNCYNEYSAIACTSTQITAISADGGGNYVFNRRNGNPVRISFADTTDTQMDQVVACTVRIDGYDSDGNRWTVQLGNYTANTWDTGTGQTITTPEATYYYDCMAYFNLYTNDYQAFNDFGVRITTNDGGTQASAYIDWVRVYINYSLKDITAPSYSNIQARPVSPATYSPSNSYKFNTTWTDNEALSAVRMQHNFTGSLQNYSMTGNVGPVYYYDFGSLPAGRYVWRTWANDTSGNKNYSMPLQTYIINKATPSFDLKLNGASSNISIERKSYVWINGSLIAPSSGSINLFLGAGLIGSGPSPLSSYIQMNSTGLFEAKVIYAGNQNYTSGSKSYFITVSDTIPPASITGLMDTKNGTSWILWNWTNPTTDDFNHTEIWVNTTFFANVSKPISSVNVTGLTADRTYEIQVRTVDNSGNKNASWVTDLGRTKPSADTTPPVISNVKNTSITDLSVNVSFETDENAKPKVYYGTQSGVYTQSVYDLVFDQFHWFLITGLKPSTTYYYLANAVDVAANEANSTEYSFTTLPDTTPPSYSGIAVSPPSPATYSPTGSYQANTTWTDNGYISTVWIENNLEGILANHSITGNVSSKYYYDLGPVAAGTYSWRMWANDTAGNINSIPWQTYVISKASSSVNLLLNGTDGDRTINESQYVNITGILTLGQGNITLWNGASLLKNGSSPLTRILQFNIPGVYTIKADYAGNQNYTSSFETHTLTVNDIIAPNVTLTNPIPPYTDMDGDMIFYYNIIDSGTVSNCSIYINSTLYDTKTIFTQGQNTFNINGLSNGFYLWNVTCIDTAYNIGYSQTWNFTVQINEYYPTILPKTCSDSDGTCVVSSINVSDTLYETHTSSWNKNNRYDYIYINFTNPNIPAGSTIHWLNISYFKYQNTIDGSIFLEWLNTSNGQWIEICTRAFTTASTPPTYDDINCEFNSSGNPWPTLQDFNNGLQFRSRWYYSGGAAASVAHGTQFTGIYMKYTEDMTPPTVELVNPENYAHRNVGNILFEYIPSDGSLTNCSLWGNFNGTWEVNQTKAATSGILNSFTVYLLTGVYDWNVQCFDVRSNNAFSIANWSVNITNPDLEISSGNIIFSNNSPREQQQITINATVRNIGNVNATNPFKVQFFRGDPDSGGVQIGTNQTISSLGLGKNVTVNVTWTVSAPGPISIYLVVDAPLATNGSVKETNENNNKAYKTINVPSWTIIYGNISATIRLDANTNDSFSDWALYSPQGNIYAVETGSVISWNSLQALGRKADNTTASNDFIQADTKIGMTGFTDSLYSIFTNSGTPKATASFSSYYHIINNVPIRNSTINGNFITGVLWDSGDGGTEYDGTQDIVFITKINQDQIGKYGNYDYEVNVPALLRNYSETMHNTIDYYTEII